MFPLNSLRWLCHRLDGFGWVGGKIGGKLSLCHWILYGKIPYYTEFTK